MNLFISLYMVSHTSEKERSGFELMAELFTKKQLQAISFYAMIFELH